MFSVYVTICLAGLTGEDRARFLRDMGEGTFLVTHYITPEECFFCIFDLIN